MEIVRLFAVALAAAAWIGCTAEAEGPPELATEPEPAESASPKKSASSDATDPELEPEQEAPLTGQPRSTSSSPLCGTGLTCSVTTVGGSKACRADANAIADVYCCPNRGDRIVNGACTAPAPAPLCGTGLTCSGSPTVGASACRQTSSSTKNVYCCPLQGAKIVGGKCV